MRRNEVSASVTISTNRTLEAGTREATGRAPSITDAANTGELPTCSYPLSGLPSFILCAVQLFSKTFYRAAPHNGAFRRKAGQNSIFEVYSNVFPMQSIYSIRFSASNAA